MIVRNSCSWRWRRPGCSLYWLGLQDPPPDCPFKFLYTLYTLLHVQSPQTPHLVLHSSMHQKNSPSSPDSHTKMTLTMAANSHTHCWAHCRMLCREEKRSKGIGSGGNLESLRTLLTQPLTMQLILQWSKVLQLAIVGAGQFTQTNGGSIPGWVITKICFQSLLNQQGFKYNECVFPLHYTVLGTHTNS